ncbi:pectate lyase family protein [Echinicola salinicaeni]|uniref:pectate lyase family protein n=1 Tax=Echinicola salinicaeni TaxID=2762757 RepID=UPI0016488F2D|nr:pectate lyase [Echinicola salinicaeni]
MKQLIGLIIIICFAGLAYAQENGNIDVLAFPGADGFGKYTSGGRGGKVLVVSNLNNDGPGSLRAALRKKYPRIVVFSVSGNIELESSLDINYGNLTIAGQSAPGDGITIQNYPIKIKGDNVIIRYIRSRLGDLREVQDDAMTCIRNKDIIIDHCSLSWATDECGSFYDNENFTLQWCIISESLNESVHAKGDHGYGGIWGGMKATFHHNLLASHNSRLPRFNGARYHKMPEKEVVDFRNNVIYNWKSNSSYAGEEGHYNIVGNYYKAGPATHTNRDRIVEPYAPFGKFFVEGNIMTASEEVSEDNSKGIDGVNKVDDLLVADPFPYVIADDQIDAKVAYENVLAKAGASFKRDQVDERVVQEVRLGNSTFGNHANGIIDSQSDVGGWPLLKSEKAPLDTDQDGMPDTWEKKHHLDPNSAVDAAGFDLDKKYTNIEIYLNGLIGD